MTVRDPSVEYIQRFAAATISAMDHGTVRKPDADLRVFLLGPVTLELIGWVSERDDIRAVSRVERDDGEFMTVMVN